MNGAIVNKAEEATNFEVNERSTQRDIDDIRNYLEQNASEHGIFNEGRAFTKDEMIDMWLRSQGDRIKVCK